jgi:hypothetical protein
MEWILMRRPWGPLRKPPGEKYGVASPLGVVAEAQSAFIWERSGQGMAKSMRGL